MRLGVFPASQKLASVTPVLKKASLDPLDLSNYRPISNLTFLSKLLERAVYEQIIGYLDSNRLLPETQSAYRKNRSTETTTIKVMSDAYQAADAGLVTLLGLLDLCAAFDTVDHQILLSRLQHDYCITGQVIEWIQSYLTGRTQFIRFNGSTSRTMTVTSGVPQGSVLGLILFITYSAEVINIVEHHVSRLTLSSTTYKSTVTSLRMTLPLTTDAAHSMVRALIHARVDYCNRLLASCPKYLTDNLQSVLRAAARLVLQLPYRSSITDLMHRQLHWLDRHSETGEIQDRPAHLQVSPRVGSSIPLRLLHLRANIVHSPNTAFSPAPGASSYRPSNVNEDNWSPRLLLCLARILEFAS